jgi:hypothetical protein
MVGLYVLTVCSIRLLSGPGKDIKMAKPKKKPKKSIKTRDREEASLISNEIPIQRRPALSGWPMILGWLAMVIFAFHASTHMVGAGDTWVAMACGRHFLNHGVDTVEPFSANSHKPGPTPEEIKKWPGWAKWIAGKVSLETLKYWHPTGWVNQNWLTHVIFYWLTHDSPIADADTFPPSFNQLVYWKIAIYIISVICVYYTGRILGANPALSVVFACFAMFVGRSYFDVRPAGFSNMLVAVYLLILVLATYRSILYIWLLVPIVTFWCNVHGGYIYAFIMLVPFVALNFLTVFSQKRFVSIGLKGIYHTVAAGFVTFIASIIFNPFHLTNLTHTYVISFSKHAEMWRTVNEWHPAFEWSNPVGTSFPFLVLIVLSIGLTLLWLLSRLLVPRFLKAPKNEMDAQKKLFINLSGILGCGAAVLICWVTLISFSLLNLSTVDFIISAAFVGILLLSIYKSVHFISLIIPLTLLALWAAKTQPGYNGRYIYSFILLPAYAAMSIVASLISKNVKIKLKNIIFVVIAAIVTLLLTAVLVNPFKFKEPVWHLTQFLNLNRLMRPVYERNVDVSYTHLFKILYILNIASIVIWLAVPYLRTVLTRVKEKAGQDLPVNTYELPKIDLAFMSIAALTIYMAVKSRRFIPIAAIAGCPVLALFIDQMIRTFTAARNFHERSRLSVSSMPQILKWCLIVAGAAAVLASGIGWGLKFKCVYLDAWPTDTKLNSIFMRMTASDAKPFYACMFIRDNKLEGNIFNYWTEGGFIAYGQNPDPNTGRTPLRLFMDGRAQAAYEPDAYRLWSDIMFGGQTVYEAKAYGRSLTSDDYVKIGKWVEKRLREYKVWVVLMPTSQFEVPFVQGLEHNPDWPLVFLSDKQKMFVDIKTQQGMKLFEGIFNGSTIYPDRFTSNLIKAKLWFSSPEQGAKKQALEFAKEAFREGQTQMPIREIMYAARFLEVKDEAERFFKEYLDQFEKNKKLWAKEHGYHNRIAAVLNVCNYFKELTIRQNNSELMQFYDDKIQGFNDERRKLLETKRW